MIEIAIPGFGLIQLEHLVCDYNGTLALDGALIDGVAPSHRRPVQAAQRACCHGRHLRHRRA